MTSRSSIAVPILSAVLAVSGCEPRSQQLTHPPLFTEGSGVRVLQPADFETVWQYGGIGDTLLSAPGQLVAAPGGALYVHDRLTQQVIRFSDTGEVEWVWGVKGDGPGEVRGVRSFDVTSDGGVVLADADNCRLVFLSRHGNLERERRTTCEYSLIEGVAVLASGDVVLDTNGDPPWELVSEQGSDGRVQQPEVPWSGFREMPFMQRYGMIEAWRDDAWIFGFMMGNGWIIWERDRVEEMVPYVAHTPFPELQVQVSSPSSGETVTMTGHVGRPEMAAYDIEVQGDTMYLLADFDQRRRVLDRYSISDRQYISSFALPEDLFPGHFAVQDSMIFVEHNQGLYPHITALRIQRAGAIQ